MSGLEGNPSATSSAVAGSATGSSVEVCRLFGHRNYRPSFEFTFTLPPKNEKPLTAKNVTPYRITAEEIAPYFGYTASAKVVFAEKQKTAYRHKVSAVLHCRRKNTAAFWLYRFRQGRYRQKRENRQPLKNYHRMAVPPPPCPPKNPLPTTTLGKRYKKHNYSHPLRKHRGKILFIFRFYMRRH